MQCWIDRWTKFRKDGNGLSNTNVAAIIDRMTAELNEARVRNFSRWSNIISSSQWPNAVSTLKTWMLSRGPWIDGHFLQPPEFTEDGGHLNEIGRRLVAEQFLILLANLSE